MICLIGLCWLLCVVVLDEGDVGVDYECVDCECG